MWYRRKAKSCQFSRSNHNPSPLQDQVYLQCVVAGSQTVAVQTALNGAQGTLNWVLSDNLNSTTVTANADGTFNSELRYSAFGEIRYSSGSTPTNYQYTGQLSQQAVGLDMWPGGTIR